MVAVDPALALLALAANALLVTDTSSKATWAEVSHAISKVAIATVSSIGDW